MPQVICREYLRPEFVDFSREASGAINFRRAGGALGM